MYACTQIRVAQSNLKKFGNTNLKDLRTIAQSLLERAKETIENVEFDSFVKRQKFPRERLCNMEMKSVATTEREEFSSKRKIFGVIKINPEEKETSQESLRTVDLANEGEKVWWTSSSSF